MQSLRIILRPLSAFGGVLKGDTLFGQLCWAVRNRYGVDRLRHLLEGYTEGNPFVVCSDAFPIEHLPRPTLPLHRFDQPAALDRKAVKRLRWLPRSALSEPLSTWLGSCRSEQQVLEAMGSDSDALTQIHAQPHNSIDRRTNTTGGGQFAPYTQSQHWFGAQVRLECWIAIAPDRLTTEEIGCLLDDIGRSGYGRDASIGLGKFVVDDLVEESLPCQQHADACFTLAPCAPQGLGFHTTRCFYEVFTRFGRHGDIAVYSGRPFKAPVLMAQTGALLAPDVLPQTGIVGRGLGGDGSLSNAVPGTVQQGYAPFIGVRLPEESE